MITVEFIGNFNPFNWPEMRCPVCGKNEYTSLSLSSVWCDECNAEFKVRHTAGDPGCVIDCITKKVYAPKAQCPKCELAFGTFKKNPKCPKHGKMQFVDGVRTQVHVIEGMPKYFYLILKLGDYCSKWIGEDDKRLEYPTQQQWDAFQNTEGWNKNKTYTLRS